MELDRWRIFWNQITKRLSIIKIVVKYAKLKCTEVKVNCLENIPSLFSGSRLMHTGGMDDQLPLRQMIDDGPLSCCIKLSTHVKNSSEFSKKQ